MTRRRRRRRRRRRKEKKLWRSKCEARRLHVPSWRLWLPWLEDLRLGGAVAPLASTPARTDFVLL
jgi:hypothetical protein